MDRHGGQRARWIPDYSLQRSPVDSFVAYPAPVLHNRDRTSFTTTSPTGHQRATRESPSLSLSLCVLRIRVKERTIYWGRENFWTRIISDFSFLRFDYKGFCE